MTEKQKIEINQLNLEIKKYHESIWILIDKFNELNNLYKQQKIKISNTKKEQEKLYSKYKIIRNKYLIEDNLELSKKWGQEMKISGQRHTMKWKKVMEQEKRALKLKEECQILEKEINELEIILNQKLDKIPTILNDNFNHIKNKANDEKIDNLQNIQHTVKEYKPNLPILLIYYTYI
ncbi:hypothetical protein [Spiroplasma endosymbiont of Zeiraphera isertana]|uniref:hypothetical protein n=1 Tax=Spiroplasma endosymbiont of Zeiraphera isertana TaxID=3066313 RepID=UPI00313B2F33